MKETPRPCRACGKPDAWYWCCLACNAKWKNIRNVGLKDFINTERTKNGLPHKDDHWDPLVGGTA